MKYILLLAAALLTSCSKDTKFVQFKKDWDKMMSDRFSENKDDSLAAIADNSMLRDSAAKAQPKPTTAFKSGEKRKDLVDFARQYIGTPYSFACSTPEDGFDCSGFLYYVFNKFGYNVPRSSAEYEFFGKEISIQNAKRGDLVLFIPTENDSTGARIGHIGILINEKGMNSDFIHSSSGKANGVTISSLGSDHYTKRFVKAINIIDPAN